MGERTARNAVKNMGIFNVPGEDLGCSKRDVDIRFAGIAAIPKSYVNREQSVTGQPPKSGNLGN